MATLNELLDEIDPKDWPGVKHRYDIFYPKFKDRYSRYVGMNETGDLHIWSGNGSDLWEIYKEPKKKVTRWLWVYKEIWTDGTVRWTTTPWYYSETEAHARESDSMSLIKLEWSEQEFEE